MTRDGWLVLLTFAVVSTIVYFLLNLRAVLSWLDAAWRVFHDVWH